MKTNILYLIDSLDYGGAEKQLVELIDHMDTDRFGLHLCCLKPSGSLYDELEIPRITIPFKGFASPSIYRSVRELTRYLKDNNIHLVQTFFQDPFLLAAMAKPFCHFKLVGTFLDLGFWRTPAENIKMRLAYRFFDGFIANSEAVKNHFVVTDHLSPDSVTVIYNGFDASQLEGLGADKSNNGQFRIGIVANLNRPVKRVEDFIHAAALVHRQYPQACFDIAGDGHLKQELYDLAVTLGIGNAVSFLGRIPRPLEVICHLDVGVICSESEGFSNSIMEYMACGVPVVVTDVGGNPELVIEQENGFLVPVGQPEDLADRICRLLGSPELSAQIGEKNRNKILQQFSVQVLARNHGRYYRGLVGASE